MYTIKPEMLELICAAAARLFCTAGMEAEEAEARKLLKALCKVIWDEDAELFIDEKPF